MALPVSSQITLKKGEVKTFVNESGDTLIAMRIDDAKTILTDVLNYQIADSIIKEYEAKDIENTKIIILQKEAIVKLTEKCENQSKQIDLLNKIIDNKDSEVTLLNNIITDQKREIRKQKTLKIIGFSGSIILPILAILLIK
jgi:hypothetical protein